jgi:alkanesulfonate monooxygenase SsuD/methylene tetrahydromethanopterin reductase-like flavin-dependent oxidoreductase (luciferase family)
VVLLPFFHPLRIASRIATLDILSGGRVEFGTGRGASPVEYQVYGVPIEKSREMWEECLDVVLAAWKAPDNFAHEGKYYKFPAVSIYPRPLQQPHPPVWCASVTPEGWDAVARKGLSLLGLTIIKTLDEVTADIDFYFKRLAHYGHDPLQVNMGMVTPVYVAPTTAEARAEFEDPLIWYFKRSVHLVTHYRGEQTFDGKYTYFGQEAASMPQRKAYDALQSSNMIVVGDPDHCIRKIEEYEKAGVNHILCLTHTPC